MPKPRASPCCWKERGTNCDWLLSCSCRNSKDHSPSRPKACGVKVQTISSRGLTVMWSCKWTWCRRWARAQGSSPAQRARRPHPPEPSSCQKTTRLTSSRSTSSKSPPSVMSATTWLLVRNNFSNSLWASTLECAGWLSVIRESPDVQMRVLIQKGSAFKSHLL